MKKNNHALMFLMCIVASITILSYDKANANVTVIVANKKIISCAHYENGELIEIGNTCEDGTKQCIANPCQ